MTRENPELRGPSEKIVEQFTAIFDGLKRAREEILRDPEGGEILKALRIDEFIAKMSEPWTVDALERRDVRTLCESYLREGLFKIPPLTETYFSEGFPFLQETAQSVEVLRGSINATPDISGMEIWKPRLLVLP